MSKGEDYVIGDLVPLKEVYRRMIELEIMTKDQAIQDLKQRLQGMDGKIMGKEIKETLRWLKEVPR